LPCPPSYYGVFCTPCFCFSFRPCPHDIIFLSFPPSGLAVNVHHSDCSPNFSDEFGKTLVENVSPMDFVLVSEFELVVNSVLVSSGCTCCRVLHDDTFGLFACHHTPGLSLFRLQNLQIIKAQICFLVSVLNMMNKVRPLPLKLLLLGSLVPQL